MARTATKRNSKSALPPAKQRRTSRCASPEPENQPSDGLFIEESPVSAKHVKKRARKSEPAPKTRADEEYEEDVGRLESQQFISLVRIESKEKKNSSMENRQYMESFETRVREKEERLSLLLAAGEEAIRKRESQFLDTFKVAYGAARSQVSVPQPDPSSGPVRNFATMHKKNREIISTAFTLVAKFEEVEERISGLDTTALIQNEWGNEDEAYVDLLTKGKELGIERYRRMLMHTKEKTFAEEDQETKGFFDEQAKARGWGKVIKKQEKAFHKLAKTVEIVAEDAGDH